MSNPIHVISEQMGNFYNRREVEYSMHVLQDIVQTTLNNKSAIIEVFSKFETWDAEKLRIKFELEIPREILLHSIRSLYRDLENIDNLRELAVVLRYVTKKVDTTVDEFYKLLFERYGFKANMNAKLSRVFSKAVQDDWQRRLDYVKRNYTEGYFENFKTGDNFKEHNKLLARIGDTFAESKLKQTWYLSISPYDFARMSDGTSWSSCHDIDGCHRAGAISYMLDKMSALFYMEDDKGQLISRQWVGIEHNAVHFNRKYGASSTNDGAINQVYDQFKAVVSSDCDIEIDTKSHLHSTPNSQHYRDYHDYNSTILTLPSGTFDISYDELVGRVAICLQCGNEFTETDELTCGDCNNSRYCAKCGDTHNADDMTFVDGDYYCSDCFENTFVICSVCDGILRTRGGEYYTHHDEIVCDSCYNRGDYISCERCGDVMTRDESIAVDTDGYTDYYCVDCAPSIPRIEEE